MTPATVLLPALPCQSGAWCRGGGSESTATEEPRLSVVVFNLVNSPTVLIIPSQSKAWQGPVKLEPVSGQRERPPGPGAHAQT